MAEFVLEDVTPPTSVYAENVRGLLGSTVHLTDGDGRTLCGLQRKLVVATVGSSCAKCLQAVDGKARVKRKFR